MPPIFRILPLLLGALFPTYAAAAEKVPWYQVEILVFSRSGAALNSETWPIDVTPPPAGRELSAWRGYSGPDSTPFQRLPATSLQMKKEYERLKAAAETKPLLHMGWLQPGLAKEEAVAIRIKSDADNGPWVEGSVRLVLSRYLHLETNLLYHRAGEDIEDPALPKFQLLESRRMRSREFHYMDHPLFGVIAVVTPYELPAR